MTCSALLPTTRITRASTLVSISSAIFRYPMDVTRTVAGCYVTRRRASPSARKRFIGYILHSLTLHCGANVRTLGQLLPRPMAGLCMVNKKDRGGCLGQLARRTVNVPIMRKPIRTATVNGVERRVGWGRRRNYDHRLGSGAVDGASRGGSVLGGSKIDCLIPFVLVAFYFTL